ncbi:MAG: hypothetical protein JHD01_03255 [Candidatus Nanopelagicales bacterium]|nr:hypothetical protein [Candidatus Nanopelagicales bacterium]
MANQNTDETTVDDSVINSTSEWIQDPEETLKKGSKSWLSRSIVVSSSSASRKINELEQQVKALGKRPNIFELDDAEITAIAGEDAATLIRAAKSKAQSVLLEAEKIAQGIRETSSAQLSATKEENKKLIETTNTEIARLNTDAEKFIKELRIRAQNEYDASDKEAKRIVLNATAEAHGIVEAAKSEELRITSESSKRAEEWMARTRSEAQAESRRLSEEAQAERKRAIDNVEIQLDSATRVAAEAAKVRRSLASASTQLRQALDDALAVATEVEQKTQAVTDKTASVKDGI